MWSWRYIEEATIATGHARGWQVVVAVPRGGEVGGVVAIQHHPVLVVPLQDEEARSSDPPEPAPDHHHVRLRSLCHPEQNVKTTSTVQVLA